MPLNKSEELIGFIPAIITGCAAYFDNISNKIFSLMEVTWSFDYFTERFLDIFFASMAAFCVAGATFLGRKAFGASYQYWIQTKFGKRVKSFFKK